MPLYAPCRQQVATLNTFRLQSPFLNLALVLRASASLGNQGPPPRCARNQISVSVKSSWPGLPPILAPTRWLSSTTVFSLPPGGGKTETVKLSSSWPSLPVVRGGRGRALLPTWRRRHVIDVFLLFFQGASRPPLPHARLIQARQRPAAKQIPVSQQTPRLRQPTPSNKQRDLPGKPRPKMSTRDSLDHVEESLRVYLPPS